MVEWGYSGEVGEEEEEEDALLLLLSLNEI